ncbi:YopX family protein [Paenibacillus polymyxa]|uniref:YopX family protein n=1 Tax=Paenibacillus polymyxa TaxID=1406 RepID=UPI00298CBD57|nr:YopX family protein [Paenibacillus polymyxa]
MRDIKFRGKKINYGEWIYGVPVFDGDKAWIVKRIGDNFSADEVHPESVGQYTGTEDRHGKDIYEGDVLRHVNPHWGHKDVQLRLVEWENKTADNGQLMNCGFAFKQIGRGFFTYYSPEKDLEIIGRIHDNPELLQGENKLG